MIKDHKEIISLKQFLKKASNNYKANRFIHSKLAPIFEEGIYQKSINEITGEHGSGKSTFCMFIAVLMASPAIVEGLGKRILYITTNKVFSEERIDQIIKSNVEREDLRDITRDNIVYLEAKTVESYDAILSQMDNPIADKKFSAFFLDDMTSLADEKTIEQDNLHDRQQFLDRQIIYLRELVFQYDIFVFVVNSVTTIFDSKLGSKTVYDKYRLKPKLGNRWKSNVHTRIFMSKQCTGKYQKIKVDDHTVKTMEVVFSNFCRQNTLYYSVSEGGIKFIQ